MPAKSNQMTGAQLILRALKKYDLTTAFCLAGTAHGPLLVELAKDKISVISGRNESATVGAADGYARVTGKLGVALINAEHGLPNAMTGILTAQEACSPVIVLLTMPYGNRADAQGGYPSNVLSMVSPFVKYCQLVPDADRLQEYIEVAARHALSGRPGVAVLGVPNGFQTQAITYAEGINPAATVAPTFEPDADAIAQAALLLSKAKRPLILAGSGAALSGAGDALRKFTKAYNIPIFANALGRGLVPEDDVLSYSWPLANGSAAPADVVMVLGMRLTQRMGYGLAPRFDKNAKFIQIDVHPEEIGRNRPIHVPVVSDAKQAVQFLHQALKELKTKPKAAPTWIKKAMKPRLERIQELATSPVGGPIQPFDMARAVTAYMPKNAIYAGDGADTQNWMHGFLRVKTERSFLDHYPVGCMGTVLPLAVGAAAATKEEAEKTGKKPRPVVLVSGDGAFGFYCSEINGAVQAGLPLLTIICNDGAWGTEKHGQIMQLGEVVNCELGHNDYQLIGEAYGAFGLKVEDPAELDSTMKKAYKAVPDGPVVVNVIVDGMAGLVRKKEPLVQTIAFSDLLTGQKAQYDLD
ncbi:MAG: thiamine pyrophosphate-binding protein [Rhodospirillaceae bacterium]